MGFIVQAGLVRFAWLVLTGLVTLNGAVIVIIKLPWGILPYILKGEGYSFQVVYSGMGYIISESLGLE